VLEVVFVRRWEMAVQVRRVGEVTKWEWMNGGGVCFAILFSFWLVFSIS